MQASWVVLQVVVSKAPKHTVLVCAACSLALPIQHEDFPGVGTGKQNACNAESFRPFCRDLWNSASL